MMVMDVWFNRKKYKAAALMVQLPVIKVTLALHVIPPPSLT